MSRLLSLLRIPLAIVMAAVACAAILLPPATAQAVTLMPGASTAHPYSDPVWWPLRTETKMDCYSGNPGCDNPRQHPTWLMDVVSTQGSSRPFEPVYAMGAGIVHYGVYSNQGCGGVHGRGNWLWIDHGNGTLSSYGHLAWPFKVPNGAYVTPKTQIALIGNSGYSNCYKYPWLHYIDIAVKRGAANGIPSGQYVQFFHLFACVNGVRQSWPAQLNRNWRVWNDVPSSPGQIQHIIPASDRNSDCIPGTNTPDRSPYARLSRAGSNALRATWTLPSTGAARSSTVVLIYEYHPAIRRWLELSKHVVGGNVASTTFTALHHNHQFKVLINFHNVVGYSGGCMSRAAVAR